jgi:hypothetical protein
VLCLRPTAADNTREQNKRKQEKENVSSVKVVYALSILLFKCLDGAAVRERRTRSTRSHQLRTFQLKSVQKHSRILVRLKFVFACFRIRKVNIVIEAACVQAQTELIHAFSSPGTLIHTLYYFCSFLFVIR